MLLHQRYIYFFFYFYAFAYTMLSFVSYVPYNAQISFKQICDFPIMALFLPWQVY